MKKRKQVLLAVLVMMLGYGTSLQTIAATSLPSSLSMATGGGTIDYISGKSNEIVVDDSAYSISPTLVVRTITGKMLGGLSFLRPGQKIAYKIATQSTKGQKGAYLVEAWLLPANFKLPEGWQ